MRCIDGDALKEKAWDAKTQCGYVQVVDVGDIDDMPTIEPEREKGEWVPCPNRGWGEIWECSHCGEETTSSIMGEPRYRFCPMCGWEMMNGGEPEDIPMEYFESGGR